MWACVCTFFCVCGVIIMRGHITIIYVGNMYIYLHGMHYQ